jgi:hypothetical protein
MVLESGHFKVGGEVNAAAGPVSGEGSAEAAWEAAILTYAKGEASMEACRAEPGQKRNPGALGHVAYAES